MNCVGIVFTLEGPAILIDLCIASIQIFIGGFYGYVLVPVVLNCSVDPNLMIQGQVWVLVFSSEGDVSIERS